MIKWNDAENPPKDRKRVILFFKRYGYEIALGYWSELDQTYYSSQGDAPDYECYPLAWAEFNPPDEKILNSY